MYHEMGFVLTMARIKSLFRTSRQREAGSNAPGFSLRMESFNSNNHPQRVPATGNGLSQFGSHFITRAYASIR